LDHGVDHLRMFNVSQYIVRSQQAKDAVAKHPGLELEKRIGQYEIYRLKDNDGRYAVPLAVAPALVVTPHWKDAAYRWFKSARPGDPVPVFAESVSAEEWRAFPLVYAELPRELPRQPLLELPPIPAAAALVQATGRWSGRMRGAVLGAGLAAFAVVFGLAAVAARATDADGTYRQGQAFYGAGRLAEAVPFFERARRLAP